MLIIAIINWEISISRRTLRHYLVTNPLILNMKDQRPREFKPLVWSHTASYVTALTKTRTSKSQLRVFSTLYPKPTKTIDCYIKFCMLFNLSCFLFEAVFCLLVCFDWLTIVILGNNFLVLNPTSVRKGSFWLQRHCLALLLPKRRHSSISSSPTGSGGNQWEKTVAWLFNSFSHVMIDWGFTHHQFFFFSHLFYLLPAHWPYIAIFLSPFPPPSPKNHRDLHFIYFENKENLLFNTEQIVSKL